MSEKIIIPGEPSEEDKNKKVLDAQGNEVESSQEKKEELSDAQETSEQKIKETQPDQIEKIDETIKEGEKAQTVNQEATTESEVSTSVWTQPAEGKKVFKAGVIDTTALAEAQARDLGDQRMTESKEDRSKNWFSRNWGRIWKHGIAQEYYRQKEISKARKEIFESGNLYAGEGGGKATAHDDAMKAIVERFTSEYEKETLRKEELESKSPADVETNKKIKDLISAYASDPHMTQADFDAEKTRILSGYDKSYTQKNSLHADNLFAIAKEVRNAIDHGTKLEDMDFEVKLSLGKARESLNSEMKKNTFDSFIEKAQNSKFGRIFANEPTAVAIAAGLYSAGSFLGMKALRSKAGQIGSFGATTLIASGVTGLKESARLERERVQHMRERAKGMEFKEDDMKRREKMEESRYETKAAAKLISGLETDLASIESGTVKPEDMNRMIANLADIESRIALGDTKKVDLVGYTRFDTVEEERTKLLVSRARLKAALRKQDTTFDEKLSQMQGTIMKDLEKGENGLEQKNKLFKKMKHKEVAKAMLKTALIGTAAGVVAQEVGSFFKPNQDGFIEGGAKRFFGGKEESLTKHATALEGLRRWMFGENPHVPFGKGHEVLLDGKHFQLPDNVNILDNGDGTYNIMHGDTVIADHTALDSESLRASGIFSSESITYTDAEVTETAKDYIDKHPELTHKIHRELWYDNDTPKPVFDKNELRTDWGGEGGTGINKDGDYVFNISRMTSDGSFHGLESTDAQESIKKHGLKMLFSLSRDTQHQVFEIPIDEHGNAIIEKDSQIAKLMFEEKDGHAVFKGKFAEIAQSMGTADDGAEKFRILSTTVGEGQDLVTDGGEEAISNVRLDVLDKTEVDIPQFIPIPHRRPLEAGSYIDKLPEKRRVETQKSIETPAEPTPKAPEGEKAEEESQEVVEKKEEPKKFLSTEEHDALKDDIAFLNKKIQNSEGIITVEESDLKSELGRARYNKLKDIPEGIPVSFNREELRKIGDELETALVHSKPIKTPEDYRESLVEKGTWKAESLKINKDIALLTKIIDTKGDIKLKITNFKSEYGKKEFQELEKTLAGKKINRKQLTMLRTKLHKVTAKPKKKTSQKGQ